MSRPGRWPAVLALALAAGASGCSVPPAEERAAPGSSAAVAVRATDLPGGPIRCGFSGPVATFARSLGPMASGSARGLATAWEELEKVGALDGHLAVYADSERACRYFLVGPPEGDVGAGGRLVSTLVTTFVDPSAAVEGYRADAVGQVQVGLAGGPGVVTAEASGLGAYSVARYDSTSWPAGLAVWQAGPFNVHLIGVDLTRAEFEGVVGAVDRRARSRPVPDREPR